MPTVIMPLSNIQKKCCSFKTTNPEKTKSGDPDSDVPMGCYDVAEACELVGIFILTKLSNIRVNEALVYTVMIVLRISEIIWATNRIFKDCGLL